MTNTICGLCDTTPTRDKGFVCDRCGDAIAVDLRDVADWLGAELETAMTGEKGVRYSHAQAAGSSDGGLRVNWAAADARARLRVALAAAVCWCQGAGVRHCSPHHDTPALGDVADMADWLVWRVDGICLMPEGPRHGGAIRSVVFAARRVVDCPPEREFLGSCLSCGRGRLYAIHGEALAVCDVCRTAYEAREVRDYVLDQLDDKVMTAAEIARVCTHLGLRADRTAVRKRLNTWHRRGIIVAEPSTTDEVVFRFGPIWRRLILEDNRG